MAMTKKHYEMVAECFRWNPPRDPNGDPEVKRHHEMLADELAEAFRSDNPNFDRERFLKACGVTQ